MGLMLMSVCYLNVDQLRVSIIKAIHICGFAYYRRRKLRGARGLVPPIILLGAMSPVIGLLVTFSRCHKSVKNKICWHRVC